MNAMIDRPDDDPFHRACGIIRLAVLEQYRDRGDEVTRALAGTGLEWSMAMLGGTYAALAAMVANAKIDPEHWEEIADALRDGFLENLRESVAGAEADAVCSLCGGAGVTPPAHDLLARPPREAAEYERQRQEVRVACPLCSGSGRGRQTEGREND